MVALYPGLSGGAVVADWEVTRYSGLEGNAVIGGWEVTWYSGLKDSTLYPILVWGVLK